MAVHTTYISLYTGSAMLDEGFRQGLVSLGLPEPKPVCYVERDLEAGALLVDKILSGKLDEAPIWTDSNTFDCKPFVGKVDAVIGGFPCQPWSVAGGRKGEEDERWLWDHIKRITVEVRPRFLFLENVPGLLVGGGLHAILGDFAEIGYDAEWISIRAAHVGAPHRRERVFILAKLDDSNSTRTERTKGHNGKNRLTTDAGKSMAAFDRELDDSKHDGRTSSEEPKGAGQGILDGQEGQESTEQPTGPSKRAAGAGSMAHADSDGLVGREKPRSTGQGGYDKKKRKERTGYVGGQGKRMVRTGNVDDPNIEGLERWRRYGKCGNELPAWPPSPSDTDAWAEVLRERPDLAPATAESEVRGVADGMAGRLDNIRRAGLLRFLGNGVVPQQAATALAILYERIANNESTS